MTAYYNEFDPFAAQWLRNLIDANLIAPGVVDERSITDVAASDLRGFTQCHFFAGIGGWSLALRLAGVPDTYNCWTGSPPCQPFSTAGKQLGQLDDRHLAPAFMRLVSQCQPPVIFGEQVAAAIGKHWLDDLFVELEKQNYACGAAVLPACSFGAPHSRDRLFFGAALGNSDDAIAQGHGRFESFIFPQGWENEKRHPVSPDVATCVWSGWESHEGADGETRSLPTGFGTPAYGLSARVGRLRGYGNAIVPQVAAEFIVAFFDASNEAFKC